MLCSQKNLNFFLNLSETFFTFTTYFDLCVCHGFNYDLTEYINIIPGSHIGVIPTQVIPRNE